MYVQQSLTVIYEQQHTGGSEGSGLIDEQLYSRQLYVYGRQAQQRLSEGHVIVYYESGQEQLAAEIVKNVALAGIGRLSVFCAGQTGVGGDGGGGGGGVGLHESSPWPQLSSHVQLAAYAHELNPLVVTHTIESRSELYEMLGAPAGLRGVSHAETVLVVADASLGTMVKLNSKVRDLSDGLVKFVAAKVSSLCGFVFNDFSDVFQVADVEGADSGGGGGGDGKEIPLKSVTAITASPPRSSSSSSSSSSSGTDIKITCIDEESLNFVGLADTLEISIDVQPGFGHGALAAVISKTLKVKEVVNTKTVILKADSRQDVDVMTSAMDQGCVLMVRKSKRTATVMHSALERQLVRPSFAPCNGCLPDKRDRAQSLALLAAFRALERPEPHQSLSSFKSSMIAKLLSMDVQDPLKPLRDKGGQVGQETVDRIAERFFRGSATRRKCPATVSVVGSLTSQEAIKAVTHIYSPVSQFLMFESLDSLMPLPDEKSPVAGPELPLLPYGSELCGELARMKLFIVGSGAIGCELLKNFAMMGVGVGAGTGIKGKMAKSKSLKAGALRPRGRSLFSARGGIVLTDMDHIEKSNLNRQLLFRERHVGQPKALVAAESVLAINPALRVRALTDRVGGGGGGGRRFDDAFWEDVDVAVTALDNIDARKFVDEQCVKYRRALLDSGTLGTKGNTQVVLPFASESYSSSADPPEEAIPLCTLKSFPYQPEHCVSWARAVFDESFSQDVSTIKALATQLVAWGDASHVMSALEELPADSFARLGRALELAPRPGQKLDDVALQSLRWALTLFDDLFVVAVARLVAEHPASSLDDEGAPFWGGSRRFPTLVAAFNSSDPIHVDFVRWAAWLHAKCQGHASVSEAKVRLFCSNEALTQALAQHRKGSEPTNANPALLLQKLAEALRSGVEFDVWQPEEFEKDDLSLGHVAFAASAANLRCTIYGLRGVGLLEVQKVAGKIVPALATTTALVSGLVALELLKIASERVLLRQRQLRRRQMQLQGSNKVPADADAADSDSSPQQYLPRFRNSFVNVARPLLAFAQPVEAETFGASKRRPRGFTLWDCLELSGASGREASADAVSVADVAAYVQAEWGAELQSISLGDVLLYATFLPGAESRTALSLRDLLVRVKSEDANGPGDGDSRTASSSRGEGAGGEGEGGFWDLDLVCVDSVTGEDCRLPPLRIPTKRASAAAAVAVAMVEPSSEGEIQLQVEPEVKNEGPPLSQTGPELFKARAATAAHRFVSGIRARVAMAMAADSESESEVAAGDKDKKEKEKKGEKGSADD